MSFPICQTLSDENKSEHPASLPPFPPQWENGSLNFGLRLFPRCGSTIISHLTTVSYLAVQQDRSKRRPNYSITPSLMVSMAAQCIFPRDAPWRNECLINHHPGNNTPSSLCRMCQTLTRTQGEISLPVQPQPLI